MDKTTTTLGIMMSAGISIITMSIGALLWADSRYVSAETFDQAQTQTKKEFSNIRKNDLEDKIFELQLLDNPSNLDRAKIDRYQRQLDELMR
tara:strand:+ start:400 stop:675 length:276 start_codon:yes stop_codon:yes gene_type:complete